MCKFPLIFNFFNFCKQPVKYYLKCARARGFETFWHWTVQGLHVWKHLEANFSSFYRVRYAKLRKKATFSTKKSARTRIFSRILGVTIHNLSSHEKKWAFYDNSKLCLNTQIFRRALCPPPFFKYFFPSFDLTLT